MTDIDRRRMIRGVLGGAAFAAVGISLIPSAIEAAPVALDKGLGSLTEDFRDEFLHEAQAVVVTPGDRRRRRRRHRRWVCWWRRGRRVCGWRW